jgi:ornithine--oxo-acid transaminase
VDAAREDPAATGTEAPELLSVDDAFELSPAEVADLTERHQVGGTVRRFQRAGLDQTVIARAEGMYYTDTSGRPILDFLGGDGAMALGHNHPRILRARRRFAEEHRHQVAGPFPSQYVAALSANLARVAPGSLDVVLLCTSGAEANEIALRLAEGASRRRSHVAYARGSFHGATRAALSVTDSSGARRGLTLMPGRTRVPFGDPDALETALREDPLIGTVILETIQASAGVVVPPDGYLGEVRRICDHQGVVWIADEVQCGFGRTGRFFAFEHEGAVPDVVTLAQSLGGGASAIGAVIAHRNLLDRQRLPKDAAAAFAPSTCASMGEACVTALEAINVVFEEGLLANAAEQGTLLCTQLEEVRDRRRGSIAEVRGRGCMVGVEFAGVVAATMGRGVGLLASSFDRKLEGGLAGPVAAALLARHATLVGMSDYDRDVLRIQPPLVVRAEHVELLRERIDEVLARGPRRVVLGHRRAGRGH